MPINTAPVLMCDLSLCTRKRRHHVARLVYAVWLVGWVFIFYVLTVARYQSFLPPPAALGEFCIRNVQFLLWQQSCLLWIAAPAFAAGAITEEKTRGTILYLLATDLTELEILRDKLASKVVQIGVIALVSLPLILWFGAIVGFRMVQWMALPALLIQLIGLVAGGLLASVCCRTTTTAALSVYLGSGLVFVVAWWNGAGFLFFPFDVWQQSLFDGEAWQRLLAFAIFWALGALVCFTLSVLLLRRFCVEHHRPKKARRHLRRPPVGANPLRWKEHYVNRPLPHGILSGTSPRQLRLLVSFLTIMIGLVILWLHLPAGTGLGTMVTLALNRNISGILNVWLTSSPSEGAFAGLGIVVMALSAALVATRTAGSVSSEREQGTWDMLLTAPLEPRQLVRGKLWGIIDITRPYLVAYLLPALLLSALGGPWAAAWIGFLWLATWMLMYFVGASGMFCSVQSQTSWRSLLAALMANSWAVFMRYCFLGAPIGFVVAAAAAIGSGPMPNARLFANTFLLASSCVTLLLLFARAERLLEQAEGWLEDHERVTNRYASLLHKERTNNPSRRDDLPSLTPLP